ncbi:MAG: electron transport complex subunit RsxE, partial [Deltaproteobacteria bacterium]|nr:electron transport complex subunit RsxE [Deltaproteobacteria bacterium]
MAKSITQEFVKGLWDEIPPFRLVLGLCPILAVTKSVENGLSQVRIACFIVIIATFVIVVELLMQAYTYALFLKLGIFIPLIVVNCILLGRAEAFAYKNGVIASIADGLGIGVGNTISLVALGALREVFGSGTFYGMSVFGPSFQPFTFMVEAPGAFVCLGLMLCMMNLA